MKFQVLGPLSVDEYGTRCTPTAPTQRQLLALLLMNPAHLVSVSELTDELWDYGPPTRPVAAIHTYVMQLRKCLSARPAAPGAPKRRILTTGRGYRLVVRPGELDLDTFDERVGKARVALAAGDNETAATVVRRALASWSGPALVDVPAGPILETTISLLDQHRLNAVILRTRAELNLGRHHEMIGELSALAYQHRTNETVTAQLMVALYRSGRQADALAAFHRLRCALADEMAEPPSHEMYALYTEIISADPRLQRAPVPDPMLSMDLAYAAIS